MSPRKALLWIAAALVVFFVVTAPADASGVVKGAFHGVGAVASSVATFTRGLLS